MDNICHYILFLMEKGKEEDLKCYLDDPTLANKFQFIGIVGEGSFGKVLKVRNRREGIVRALKVQRFRKAKAKTILRNEIQIMRKLQGKAGIPKIFSFGEWGCGLYLEMQLLSHDLNQNHQYSLPEITELALESLALLEGIHKAGVIHQDLKPHNLMRSGTGQLFLVDFGLSRQIFPSSRSCAIRGFVGTPRYASVRAHNMFEQSKKDDLQSLFYNLAFLYYQKLPWSKLHFSGDIRLERIKLLKIKHRDVLFNEISPSFQRAFENITDLRPFEDPDYDVLKGLFKRSKTMIFDRIKERTPMKRVSLNLTNFLKVPSSRSGLGSCSSLTASDAVASQLLQLATPQGQNLSCEQGSQPSIPDLSRFSSRLVFKNPFD